MRVVYKPNIIEKLDNLLANATTTSMIDYIEVDQVLTYKGIAVKILGATC